MTAPLEPSLTPEARRRLLWSAVVRPPLTILVFGLAYFLLPWTGHERIGAYVAAGVVFVAVIVAATWQVRRLVRSDTPKVQAIEAFMTILPVYLLGCAAVNVVISTNNPGAFSESLSRMSGLYFTLSVFSTVGFGDIVALTDGARAAISIEIVANLVLVGLGIKVIMAVVTWLKTKRVDTDEAAE